MMTFKAMDNRWEGKRDEFFSLFNNKIGDMKVYFGAMNNAIIFYVRDAVSYVQEHNRKDYHTKMRITYIWRQLKMIEYNLKQHPVGYFKPSHYDVNTKAAFADDVTESTMYDYWVQTGAKPYIMLRKAAEVLRHRFEVMMKERGCPCYKEMAWLGTSLALLAEHETTYNVIIHSLSETLGLTIDNVREIMKPFSFKDLYKAVRTLSEYVYPPIDELTDREKHQVTLAFSTIAKLYQNPDFFFDGTIEAAEEDEDVFKSKGFRKKFTRLAAESKADFIKLFEIEQ